MEIAVVVGAYFAVVFRMIRQRGERPSCEVTRRRQVTSSRPDGRSRTRGIAAPTSVASRTSCINTASTAMGPTMPIQTSLHQQSGGAAICPCAVAEVCHCGRMSEVSLVDLLTDAGVDLEERFGARTTERLRHAATRARARDSCPTGGSTCSLPTTRAHLPEWSFEPTLRRRPHRTPRIPTSCSWSIAIDGEGPIGAVQWVSIAHLASPRTAHCAPRSGPIAPPNTSPCSRRWITTTASTTHTQIPYDRWSLFVRTPTEDNSAVALIHIGDTPPWTTPKP